MTRVRSLCLALLLALCFAGQAQAHTTVVTSSSQPIQEWVDTARVPTPEETVLVTVDAAACPGGLGCSLPGSIEIAPYAGRKVFLHELGHNFDAMYLTDEERGIFLAIIRHPDFGWWGTAADGYSYERFGAEWFADAYSQCARLPRIDPKWGYTVGAGLVLGRRLNKVCGLIRSWA